MESSFTWSRVLTHLFIYWIKLIKEAGCPVISKSVHVLSVCGLVCISLLSPLSQFLSLFLCLLGIAPWSLWWMEWLNSRVSVDLCHGWYLEFESYNWLIISSFLLGGGPTTCKFWIPTICMSVIYEDVHAKYVTRVQCKLHNNPSTIYRGSL